MESRSIAAGRNRKVVALLVFNCLFSASLPCVAGASGNVDICREPGSENRLAIGYYDHANSSFEGDRGSTDRLDYGTDLRLSLNDAWTVGLGHRSTVLGVDELVLLTNGYLHTFFLPVHKTRRSDGRRFRISIAPALSGSSNVVKDPGEFTRDAFQLLGAVVWSRPVSDQLRLSYGICGDRQLGGFQLYPVFAFDWQPHPDWRIELGYPTSQVSYALTTTFESLLRVSPNGNEWYVKNKSLEKSSTLIYEAYVLEWAFNWRLHRHLEISAIVGREFDGRYDMTLSDDRRVRLTSGSATVIGAALAWSF